MVTVTTLAATSPKEGIRTRFGAMFHVIQMIATFVIARFRFEDSKKRANLHTEIKTDDHTNICRAIIESVCHAKDRWDNLTGQKRDGDSHWHADQHQTMFQLEKR